MDMEKIQEKAISNYTHNLLFLEKVDNELFQRINLLSDLIDNNNYTPRYHLDYIYNDKNFDIYDEKTDTYLYKKQVSRFISESVKNTNFDKVNSIDLLNPDFYNNRFRWPDNVYITPSMKIQSDYIDDINEYFQIFNKETDSSDKEFKEIEKFVFAGTLLGSHLEAIDNKIQSKIYFIYENNLEIFRLSLFVADYTKIGKKSDLIFSIMDDNEIITQKLNLFHSKHTSVNYMIKYYSTNYNVGDFFDQVLLSILHNNPFNYTYKFILENLINLTLQKIPKFKIYNTLEEQELLKDKEVLLLAAGPSLSKNIKWIQENRDKFFIVAIGAVVKSLVDNKIKADLIISVDPNEVIKKQFPDSIRLDICKTPFLSAVSTSENVLKMFEYENTILFEVMSAFKDFSILPGGNSVGEVSLFLISILGGNRVYMLGTDLAFDQITGESHISDHNENKRFDIDSKIKISNITEQNQYELKDTTIKVKGNFVDTVITNTNMARTIRAYNIIINLIKQTKTNISIYNLSDGAFIEGTIPMKIEDINVNSFNKNELKREDILDHLKCYSEIGFTENEKYVLNKSLEPINKIIKELENIEKTKYKSFDDFYYDRKNVIQIINNDLIKFSKFYIVKAFENYLNMINPYFGYHFNDENLKDEKNKLKKVQTIWCSQLKALSLRYKELVCSSIH